VEGSYFEGIAREPLNTGMASLNFKIRYKDAGVFYENPFAESSRFIFNKIKPQLN